MCEHIGICLHHMHMTIPNMWDHVMSVKVSKLLPLPIRFISIASDTTVHNKLYKKCEYA